MLRKPTCCWRRGGSDREIRDRGGAGLLVQAVQLQHELAEEDSVWRVQLWEVGAVCFGLLFFYRRIFTPPWGDCEPWVTPLGGAGPNSSRFTRLSGDRSIEIFSWIFRLWLPACLFSSHLSYSGGGLMLVPWTPDSEPLSKPVGLPGPAGSAGRLTDVSQTKSRQEASLDSRFWEKERGK